GPSQEDIEGEPEQSTETEEEEPSAPETSVDSDQLLQEFSELFSNYQDALSNGNWEEAGEIMAEIESRLEQANQ
ncbi:hypothetical protein R0K20_24300, partial [Staphylococcus sp. SIMBA_130]